MQVMIPPMPAPPNPSRARASSRRDLFRLAALGGTAASAVLLEACGGSKTDAGNQADTSTSKKEDAQKDAALLNSALDLEHTALAAYTAIVPQLAGSARRLARGFLDQERDHAAELARTIEDLGGRPNRAKSAAAYRAGFPPLGDAPAALRFAVDVEETAVAAYIAAIPKCSTGQLRATVASIVTNEAEHLALLRDALNEPPVPGAFVAGSTSFLPKP
jgi:rubrerythrin